MKCEGSDSYTVRIIQIVRIVPVHHTSVLHRTGPQGWIPHRVWRTLALPGKLSPFAIRASACRTSGRLWSPANAYPPTSWPSAAPWLSWAPGLARSIHTGRCSKWKTRKTGTGTRYRRPPFWVVCAPSFSNAASGCPSCRSEAGCSLPKHLQRWEPIWNSINNSSFASCRVAPPPRPPPLFHFFPAMRDHC